MAKKLKASVHTRIKALCAEGDAFHEKGDNLEAKRCYIAALHELPEPWEDCEAAIWIFTAFGDACFAEGNFERAREAYQDAIQCPGGLGNPYIHLKLGEAQLELGNLDRAADELARAYMGAGKEIFDDENAKYFEFLQTRLREPLGGW